MLEAVHLELPTALDVIEVSEPLSEEPPAAAPPPAVPSRSRRPHR